MFAAFSPTSNLYPRTCLFSHTQYPSPVLPKEHTDLPFDVKAQTRIPKEFAEPEILEGFLPTYEPQAHLSILLL